MNTLIYANVFTIKRTIALSLILMSSSTLQSQLIDEMRSDVNFIKTEVSDHAMCYALGTPQFPFDPAEIYQINKIKLAEMFADSVAIVGINPECNSIEKISTASAIFSFEGQPSIKVSLSIYNNTISIPEEFRDLFNTATILTLQNVVILDNHARSISLDPITFTFSNE